MTIPPAIHREIRSCATDVSECVFIDQKTWRCKLQMETSRYRRSGWFPCFGNYTRAEIMELLAGLSKQERRE